MDKFAQDKKKRRMGFFNELNEDYGPGKLVEKFHEKFTGKEGEFAELMNILREIDGTAREIAVPLKNTIKAARSSFNRREYIATISYLGQYHDAFETIMHEFSKLKSAVDFKHNEFLFNGVDEEALNYFKEKLPLKFKPKAKTASLSDWWSNLTSSKGRALKAWEQRFPKFAKKFKTETEKLLTRAESLQNSLSLSLKGMASLRASRKLEEYLDAVGSLTAKYKEFDKSFEKYYNDYVKNFIEQQKIFSPNNIDNMMEIGVKKEDEVVEPQDSSRPFEYVDTSKPLDKKPADFPNEDEESTEPSWPAPNSGPASSIHLPTLRDIEKGSIRDVVESGDILSPSSNHPAGGNAPLTFNEGGAATIGNPSKRVIVQNDTSPVSGDRVVQKSVPKNDPGTRPTLVVPVFNKNVPSESRVETVGIPGMVNVNEPFNETPSVVGKRNIVHDTIPSSHKNPSSIPQPFRRSPSVLTGPVKSTPQNPVNVRHQTIPMIPSDDEALDSIPIPPVRPASFPSAPDSGFQMPLIPGPPALPKNGKDVEIFLEKLTKLSNESPLVLANEIIKFASSLDDKEINKKLLNIAKSLLK